MPDRNTALVVIDVQNTMVEEAHRGGELLENIEALLEKARSSGTSVIFIQHDDSEYEPMMPGKPGWELHPRMSPRDDEPILRKRFSDSFYETSLGDELRSRSIGHLVIAGMDSAFCVDATSRSAVERGYEVTLAGDAHTTASDEAREMMGMGFISAEQVVAHHNFLLGGIHNARPDREISVKETAEIEFSPGG